MKVKICGLTRPEDAILAQDAGASYIGAVLVSDSPRVVSPERARELSSAVTIPLVIVTGDLDPEVVAEAAETAGAAVIQVHGEASPQDLAELRARGSWELWKAVRVRTRADVIAGLAWFGEVADLLLLDGWHPSALGGSGTPFPWEEAMALDAEVRSGLRIGAAGGLSPENVAEVVRRLAPDLVDVSSGVEASPGIKDPGKVRDFVRRAREATRSI
ncbi:MAG: phosphoribosylanthranilate isomerase [Gemmatimonadota bacterium]